MASPTLNTSQSGARVVMGSYVHPSATVGPNVSVSEGASIGPNCYLDGNIIIGKKSNLIGNVTLIGSVEIGDNCILEPNVTMSNIYLQDRTSVETLMIGSKTCVGAGSVLSSCITIGQNVRIGAGTVVTRNVPSHAIVAGNPAAITGYTASRANRRATMFAAIEETNSVKSFDCSVAGVKIYKFPRIRDLRGDLSVGEFGRSVPFRPKRYFLVYDVPSAETRGEHAHRRCEQFLISVGGMISVVVDDGIRREEIELDAPDLGLYIPPRVWALQYKYSRSGTLLVFASHFYDPTDYIRDYQTFLRECGTT